MANESKVEEQDTAASGSCAGSADVLIALSTEAGKGNRDAIEALRDVLAANRAGTPEMVDWERLRIRWS